MALKICLKLIEFYQIYISFDSGALRIFAPGGACKYQPSCSEYTKQMMVKLGVVKGTILGVKRILSCR